MGLGAGTGTVAAAGSSSNDGSVRQCMAGRGCTVVLTRALYGPGEIALYGGVRLDVSGLLYVTCGRGATAIAAGNAGRWRRLSGGGKREKGISNGSTDSTVAREMAAGQTEMAAGQTRAAPAPFPSLRWPPPPRPAGGCCCSMGTRGCGGTRQVHTAGSARQVGVGCVLRALSEGLKSQLLRCTLRGVWAYGPHRDGRGSGWSFGCCRCGVFARGGQGHSVSMRGGSTPLAGGCGDCAPGAGGVQELAGSTRAAHSTNSLRVGADARKEGILRPRRLWAGVPCGCWRSGLHRACGTWRHAHMWAGLLCLCVG